MVGCCELGDSQRERLDEEVHWVIVAARALADLSPRRWIGHAVGMDQRHRMDLDQIVDDELHPRKANSSRRQAPPAEGGGRAGDVHHHRDSGFGQVGNIHLR